MSLFRLIYEAMVQRGLSRLVCLALLALLSCLSAAQAAQRSIRLSAFPAAVVADGRSAITITAEVREVSTGQFAPDGTRILFRSKLGFFRESVVTTRSGIAQAILVAGNTPGIDKVTASEVGGGTFPSVIEIDYVKDKSELLQGEEKVELFTDENLEYSLIEYFISAASSKGKVRLAYKDLKIEAKRLEYDVKSGIVKAQGASVKTSTWSAYFQDISIDIKRRTGFGTTRYMAYRPQFRWFMPLFGFLFFDLDDQDHPIPMKKKEVFALGEITRSGVGTPTAEMPEGTLAFREITQSQTITARSAVVVPGRKIIFTKAVIRLDGRGLLPIPLYQIDLNAPTGQLFADNIINVFDNQFSVNYPQYLTLSPNQESLVRFRTGQNLGRGFNANRGVFFDYELNWSNGERGQGAFTYTGMGRDDYQIGIRQYSRLSDRSQASFQVLTPAGKSLFFNTSFSNQNKGFQWTVNSNVQRSIQGLRSDGAAVNLVAEKDPIKVGKLPFRLFPGVRADVGDRTIESLQIDGNGNLVPVVTQFNQSAYGAQLRGSSDPLQLSKDSTLQAGFTVAQVQGTNVPVPLTFLGQISMYNQLPMNITNRISLDYVRDGFTEQGTGLYRLSTELAVREGNVGIGAFWNQSLDLDRQSFFIDSFYYFTSDWRIGYSYTFDRVDRSTFVDYTILIGFKLGPREVSLGYSYLTRRLGFNLVNAPF